MPSQLITNIVNGTLMQVDLLLALPLSTNVETWVKPNWPGYQPVNAPFEPDLNQSPSGVMFRLRGKFVPAEGQWFVAAFGITGPLKFAMVVEVVNPNTCQANLPMEFDIRGLATPVF